MQPNMLTSLLRGNLVSKLSYSYFPCSNLPKVGQLVIREPQYTGDGVINVVSTLESWSISDGDLTVKCGLLNKDWSQGDVHMAERGFEIQDDLAHLRVKLNISPFLKEKGQFEKGSLLKHVTLPSAVFMWNGPLSALKIIIYTYLIMCQSRYVIRVLLIKSLLFLPC